MTEEERVQRDAYLRDAMTWANAAPKPSLEARIDRLEREALERRTAILKLERDFRLVALAAFVSLAGIGSLAFCILLEILT